MSVEVGGHRPGPRANRAVAAVNEARGSGGRLGAAVLASTGLYPASDPAAVPIVRYAAFSDMLKAAQRPDPLADLKAELESMKTPPKPIDDAARLPDDVWRRITSFLGATTCPDVVHLGATCRRLRTLVLQASREAHAFETVSVVPQLLRLQDLSDQTRFDSVAAYLTAPGRAASVQHFALVESKYASTVAWDHPHFPAACALAPTLRLVARLPGLTTLDLRGVAWDCRSGARLSLLLPDLYLVAPRLETLKLGREVMPLWTPQWWEKLPHLRALVIASRREQPMAAASSHAQDGGAATHASSDEPPLLELSSDFMEMLSASQRQWCIKLWCPLTAESAQQLLFPATPHAGLVELTLNAAGPTGLALLSSCTSTSTGATEGGEGGGKKAKNKKSVSQEAEAPLLPALTTLTIANADAATNLGPQLFQRLTGATAPQLVHFNLCNTVCVPAPEKKPKKKLAATTTTATEATTASTA